jgi:hypothetical protein
MKAQRKSGMAKLGEQVQMLLHRMLDEHARPAAIAAAIKEQTGERVTPSAITHYGSAYRKRGRKQVRLRESVEELVAKARQDGIQVSDLLRALLVERLKKADKDGTATGLDLLTLEEHERKRSDFDLKERQAHFCNLFREQDMALKQRKQDLAEKVFRLRRKQAHVSFAALEQKAAAGQALTADDMQQIRAIYGLDNRGVGSSE